MSIKTAATLQDLVNHVVTDQQLGPVRRRDLSSSIRSFARHLGQEPARIPAQFQAIRRLMNDRSIPHPGISSKRWANIRSDMTFALRRYARATRVEFPRQVSPAWHDLEQKLEDPRLVRGLRRFMRWCNAEGISPEMVDDPAIARFFDALATTTLTPKPQKCYRETCRLWNIAVASVPGWPNRPVTVPSFREVLTLPPSAFPDSFHEDLERWLNRLSGRDLFGDHDLARPLRPSTLKTREAQMRYFASALVHAGMPSREITGLHALVSVSNFRRGLEWLYDRAGGKTTVGLGLVAKALVTMAKRYAEVPQADLEGMKRISKRLLVPFNGMTEKNRERLRAFDDPVNELALHDLPPLLVRQSRKEKSPGSAAVKVQMAFAIELLLNFPLRMKNLANLNLSRHVSRTRTGRYEVVHIVIPGEETKNGRPIEFELPASVVEVLNLYLKQRRPHLVRGEDPGWLFPGRNGERKHPVGLSTQISQTIMKYTGLHVNPHLFRHIDAKISLEEDPGNYEQPRRLLQHDSIDTTTKFYTGFETKAAGKRFDGQVLERRERLRMAKKRR